MSNFLDYFDGLMLGDGSLTKNEKSINYIYAHSSKTPHKEWLDVIKERFELDNIISKVSLNQKPGRYYMKGLGRFVNSSGSHRLYSHTYDFFTEQEKRWYIKDYNVDEYNTYYWHKDENGEWYARKKIVPKDIKLTPECVANWYMGDGNINKSENRYASHYGHITLSTDSFTKEEVKFLSFLLKDHVVKGTRVNIDSGKYIIQIDKRSSVHSFLDYVRPYVEQVSCFHYKIPEIN